MDLLSNTCTERTDISAYGSSIGARMNNVHDNMTDDGRPMGTGINNYDTASFVCDDEDEYDGAYGVASNVRDGSEYGSDDDDSYDDDESDYGSDDDDYGSDGHDYPDDGRSVRRSLAEQQHQYDRRRDIYPDIYPGIADRRATTSPTPHKQQQQQQRVAGGGSVGDLGSLRRGGVPPSSGVAPDSRQQQLSRYDSCSDSTSAVAASQSTIDDIKTHLENYRRAQEERARREFKRAYERSIGDTANLLTRTTQPTSNFYKYDVNSDQFERIFDIEFRGSIFDFETDPGRSVRIVEPINEKLAFLMSARNVQRDGASELSLHDLGDISEQMNNVSLFVMGGTWLSGRNTFPVNVEVIETQGMIDTNVLYEDGTPSGFRMDANMNTARNYGLPFNKSAETNWDQFQKTLSLLGDVTPELLSTGVTMNVPRYNQNKVISYNVHIMPGSPVLRKFDQFKDQLRISDMVRNSDGMMVMPQETYTHLVETILSNAEKMPIAPYMQFHLRRPRGLDWSDRDSIVRDLGYVADEFSGGRSQMFENVRREENVASIMVQTKCKMIIREQVGSSDGGGGDSGVSESSI